MKGHVEQYKWKVFTLSHIKVQIEQYKWKVSWAFENERTNWPIWIIGLWSFLNERTSEAIQMKDLMNRLILGKTIKQYKWKV